MRRLTISAALLGLAVAALVLPWPAAAQGTTIVPFRRLWSTYDSVVARGLAERSWTWGPQALTDVLEEPYAEGPLGGRQVQYYDKGRMEVNDPDAPIASPWYVSAGLLPVELITGRLQVGDTAFQQRAPAAISVAGDPGRFPTYADLRPYYNNPGAIPTTQGVYVSSFVTPTGVEPGEPGSRAIPGASIVAERNGFGIPRAFQEFMTQRGVLGNDAISETFEGQVYPDPLFIFGLPVTQPFWVQTTVGGQPARVLVQAFERRVLTYTPTNPDPWKVEMSNVGAHYYAWRYGAAQ